MTEEKKGEGFMLGFLVGGIIGAAASLLLGVQEGDEIKKGLKKKGKILLEGARDTIIEGEKLIEKEPKKLENFVQKKVQEAEKAIIKEVVKKAPRQFRHFFSKSGKKLSK